MEKNYGNVDAEMDTWYDDAKKTREWEKDCPITTLLTGRFFQLIEWSVNCEQRGEERMQRKKTGRVAPRESCRM